MSEQEQHKTWIMLKRGCRDKFIKFTSNIIPKFTTTNSVTDSYGKWSCATSGYSWSYHPGRTIFNHDTKNGCTGADSSVANASKYTTYETLTLPDGIELSIDEFVINCSKSGGSFVIYVQGYNAVDKVWETITDEVACPSSQQNVTVPCKSAAYYSKVKVAIYNKKATPANSRIGVIYEFSITKGTLKIINGLA